MSVVVMRSLRQRSPPHAPVTAQSTQYGTRHSSAQVVFLNWVQAIARW